jgi:protein JSN1
MIGRYRPPALRALTSGGSPPNEVSPSTTITPTDNSSLPTNAYSSGYRRARAGTLPSNVSLAAQQYAASNTPSPSTLTSTDSFSEQLQLLSQSSATPTGSMRPTLRHSASVASPIASSVLTDRSSRLRSGSLTTLPSTGLSNPFGSSIFSSSWLSSSSNNTAFPVLEEMRSVTSMDSGADDFDVHTLDYLGLDETHHRPPPAATISELRNQAQAVIAGNLTNPPRLRATTVSHPYRRLSSSGNALLATPNPEDEEEYEQQQYSRPALETYSDSLTPDDYFPRASGLKQTEYFSANLATSRPRAISVGTLDDSAARITRRATVSVEQPVYELSSSFNGTNSAQLSQSGILKTDKSTTLRSGAMPSVRFPVTEVSGSRTPSYLLTPNQPGRAVSPKSENPTQIQTPTRSLWIGNLDSSVTSEQLIHVFAPYGAIESLRLLPEKVKHRISMAKRFSHKNVGVWLRQFC